jgi:NADH dehydrogenase FAD-containing subunit
MATGVLSGSYESGENRIGIRHLVERGGGRFVQGRLAEVLHRDRALLLEDGRTVRYDAVSFCLGSETRGADGAVPVKPVSNLEGVRKRLMAAPGVASRVVIVGGGAAGCEVAVNLAALSRDAGLGVEVTVVEAAPDLLPASPNAARRIMRGHLGDLGVGVILGRRAVVVDGGAVLEDGTEIRADLALAATGVAPPDVFARSGLATGDDDALWVDRHLRSPTEPRIFGGGDAVAFRGERLPQFGVYAVRQGPVLYRNLQAALRGEPLSSYRPQRRYLYVLDLGDGTGLAIYGPLANRSRPFLRLKHLIDRRFVRDYG